MTYHVGTLVSTLYMALPHSGVELSLVWTAADVTPQPRVEVEENTEACISGARNDQRAFPAKGKRLSSHLDAGGGMSIALLVESVRCELDIVQQPQAAFMN